MFLNLNEVIKYTIGFVDATITEGGLTFEKCTKKQREAWRKHSHELGERAIATTGVRVDFYTNSDFVRAVTSKHRFELKINGVTVEKTEDGELCAALSGISRVTIIFPSHDRGFIKSLELSDGATVEKPEYNRKILFIGDSITQGWNSQYDSLSYAYRVSEFFNAESVINGIGGSYFSKDTFDVADFEPSDVIIAYGCNDFKHYKTQDERILHARQFLTLVKEAYCDKNLYYIKPIPRHDDIDFDGFDAMRSAMGDCAKTLGFTVIDGYLAIPKNRDFYADSLHPNDLGFGLYADYVIKIIQEKQ